MTILSTLWAWRAQIGIALAVLAVLAGLWGLYAIGHGRGYALAQGACRAAELQRELDVQIAASKWAADNAAAAQAQAVAAAEAQEKIRTVTKTIIREIPKYVSHDPVCTLGADALRMLDAAAGIGDGAMPAASAAAGAGSAPAGAGPSGADASP